MGNLIVARHSGLVEWLRQHGIEGSVVSHATERDVIGKDVIGMLPFNLAALAASVTVIDLPGLKPEQRGKELSPEEMDAAGASLSTYRVIKSNVVK